MRRTGTIFVFAIVALLGALPPSPAVASDAGTNADEVAGDAGFIAVGSKTASGVGIVRIFADRNQNGTYEALASTFSPYGGAAVADGVRVAAGDFDGDGNDEIVTATGANTSIKVFDLGSDGTPAGEIFTHSGFKSGAYVAAGDLNGDGIDELVTASDAPGRPKVVIRSDTTAKGVPSTITDTFFAYDTTFHGGVTVAMGNTDNAGGDELITAPGPGAGLPVKVFTDAGADLDVSLDPVVESFFPYGSSFNGGVNVASGQVQDVGGNGAEIVVGPLSAAKKVQIRTDTGANGKVGDEPPFESFSPYGASYTGGVRVAAGDSDGSGSLVEVQTAPGTGAGTRKLKIYDDDIDAGGFISDNPIAHQFVSMPSTVTAGAYVAFGKVRAGTFPYAGLPATIPDASTLTSTIIVPRNAGIIRDLDVFLGIAHNFDGDLDVTLTHVPTGTSLVLFTDVGVTDAGFIIVLNDEAGTDIGTADNPADSAIMGQFNPEGAAVLSAFDGQDASGKWTLTVVDDTASDTGTLFAWNLQVDF